MHKVTQEAPNSVDAEGSQSVSMAESSQEMDQFFVPSAPARSVSNVECARPAESFIGAMSLLTNDIPEGSLFNYEGHLITLQAKARDTKFADPNSSSPRKRKRSETKYNFVVDLIAVDKTGPVSITLWGGAAYTFECLLASFLKSENADTSKRPLLSLRNMEAVTVKSCEKMERSLHRSEA